MNTNLDDLVAFLLERSQDDPDTTPAKRSEMLALVNAYRNPPPLVRPEVAAEAMKFQALRWKAHPDYKKAWRP